MSLEDDLLEAMRYMNLGGKVPHNKMVQALIQQAQVGALKQLRGQLDAMIAKLSKQGLGLSDTDNLNPYKILGVSPNDTKEAIHKAYRNRAAKAHPDKGGTHEDMVRVNAAWEAIQRLRGWK